MEHREGSRPRDPQVPEAHSLSLIKDENTPAASGTP